MFKRYQFVSNNDIMKIINLFFREKIIRFCRYFMTMIYWNIFSTLLLDLRLKLLCENYKQLFCQQNEQSCKGMKSCGSNLCTVD